MSIKVVTNKKIAETSSKGNQEKWYDNGIWYKLDQFGYEALSETLISKLLEKCHFNNKFSCVSYDMEKIKAHGVNRIACRSRNFLWPEQSIITINRLISNEKGKPLVKILSSLTSDVKRLKYIVETVTEITGLVDFAQYLTLMFEIDALFMNDDRHLNNIAVIYSDDGYDYCPIFDNGAGLMSDTRSYGLDIEPKGIYPYIKAQPLNITFAHQINTMRKLYENQLYVNFNVNDVEKILMPILEYYPVRDRGLIKDRVMYCINKQIRKHFDIRIY